MQSPDQDFRYVLRVVFPEVILLMLTAWSRYMGLNDLLLEIKQDQNSFMGDESVENKVLKQVLTLVEDKISEVKNQAVKTYVLPLFCRVQTSSELSQARSAHQDHP